jgi:predicted TIM-barrel fold metal-dependent hydrolase
MSPSQSEEYRPSLVGILNAAVLIVLAVGVYAVFRAYREEPAAVTPVDVSSAGIPIINVHEHIQSVDEAPRLLAVMDALGVQKTVLVGSSWFTITLNPAVGFTRHDWNNTQLLHIVRQYPGRFEAWPTLNPEDADSLQKLQEAVAAGATGLKLYLGHGYKVQSTGEYLFHVMPMDDPRIAPIYAYCEANGLPISYHVNPGPTTPGFAEEFVAVLQAYPDLKIICPHFMLSSINDTRLRELLDTFPNLYSDISFGHDEFLVAGLKRISKRAEKFREILTTYPDRFMFGTDLVVTNAPFKDEAWMTARFQAYLDMLSKDRYTTPVVPDEELRGLALPRALLERVLHRNYEDFMANRPQGTVLTREIDWSRMGAARTRRD